MRGIREIGDEVAQHGVAIGWAGDVDDDGVPCGTLLGSEDAGDGGGVEGVGAEAVDRLCRQGDEAAAAKDVRSLSDHTARSGVFELRGIDGQAKGVHRSIVAGQGQRSSGIRHRMRRARVEAALLPGVCRRILTS